MRLILNIFLSAFFIPNFSLVAILVPIKENIISVHNFSRLQFSILTWSTRLSEKDARYVIS